MKIKTLTVGPIQANCYLLLDEETKLCAVIDPGGDAWKIDRAIKEAGCTVATILLTHGHYDHTGGVEELQSMWPEAPTYINCRDQHPQDSRFWQLCPTLPNTKTLDEGDSLTVGSMRIEALATPGHSGGSLTFRCENCLFTGDTLFSGSCGRTDFPDGSMKTIFASLKRLGDLPGDYRVFPGHMEDTTMERERRYNPYMIHAAGGKGYLG